MLDETFALYRAKYEEVYGEPLVYATAESATNEYESATNENVAAAESAATSAVVKNEEEDQA